MRIVFLSDDFPPESLGGAGTIAFMLARALKREGHDISVITTTQDKDKVGSREQDGIRIFQIVSEYHPRWRAYMSLYNPPVVREVKKILEKERPDIVHAHNIHLHISYYALTLARRHAKKVFLTAHDVMSFHYGKLVGFGDTARDGSGTRKSLPVSVWEQMKTARLRYNPVRNFFIRRCLRSVDKIFAVSDALRAALMQNGILNVVTIHNGIEREEWKTNKKAVTQFKDRFGLMNAKIILFGGRLSGLKGTAVIGDILARVLSVVPSAKLLVVGDTHAASRSFGHILKDQQLQKHIFITGWLALDEIKTAYAASDVVIIPSLYLDPFPTVALEAMASGKPVVATCFGGAPEAVADGVTGYVENPFKTDVFAHKISTCLLDTKKAAAFGHAGYERVGRDLSINEQVKKTIAWYSETVLYDTKS